MQKYKLSAIFIKYCQLFVFKIMTYKYDMIIFLLIDYYHEYHMSCLRYN